MIFLELKDLQLWLLFQAAISTAFYARLGVAGLFGSFVGAFFYILLV